VISWASLKDRACVDPGACIDPGLISNARAGDNALLAFTATICAGPMELAFADCVLKPTYHQLLRNGTTISLEPKLFTLLEILIERRPAVVTYDEIDELLWPKVYVARTSLTRVVSELRAVLGDSPGEGHVIRTVYKKGYAFAANVASVDHTHAAPTAFAILWNGRLLPLVDGENIVGRGVECSLVIDASSVSRRHARFVVSAGAATVEDLGSTNGTFLNDAAITCATALQDGDVVTLGEAVVKCRSFDPSAPTELTLRPAKPGNN
jgi:DNA-binding winged helix-turn-helix (wHTH) protein